MSIRPFPRNVIFIKEQLYCRLLTFSRNVSVRRNRKLDFWENSPFGEFPPPFDWPAGPARRERKMVLGIFYWPRATALALISSPGNPFFTPTWICEFCGFVLSFGVLLIESLPEADAGKLEVSSTRNQQFWFFCGHFSGCIHSTVTSLAPQRKLVSFIYYFQ